MAELVLCEGGHVTHMDFHKNKFYLYFEKKTTEKCY